MKRIIKVIPHPRLKGYWAISIDGSIHGKYDNRAQALGFALDPKISN